MGDARRRLGLGRTKPPPHPLPPATPPRGGLRGYTGSQTTRFLIKQGRPSIPPLTGAPESYTATPPTRRVGGGHPNAGERQRSEKQSRRIMGGKKEWLGQEPYTKTTTEIEGQI